MHVEIHVRVSDKLADPSAFVGIALDSALRAWDSEPGGINEMHMSVTTPGGDRRVGSISLKRGK